MHFKQNIIVIAILLFAIAFAQGWDCNKDSGQPGTSLFPPDPHLIYPINYSTNQSRNPVFYWTCYASGCGEQELTYTLELETSGGETVKYSPDADNLFIELIDTLDAETVYFWTVVAKNEHSKTASGETWQFTTGTGFNNPPHKPILGYPQVYDVPLDPTLTWTCIDPDGDALTYDVWFGPFDGTYELISEGQSETEYHIQDPLLEYNTEYGWQISAYDAENSSSQSRKGRFVTRGENLCPSKTSPVYPPNDAEDIPLNLTLRWSESVDPDGDDVVYIVRFDGDIIAENISETYLQVDNLSYGTEYWWEVNSRDSRGCNAGGQLGHFTTTPDPALYHGIYAELMIHRSQYISKGIPPDPDELIRLDFVSARFDSVYAPDGPDVPKQPAAVECTQTGAAAGRDLWWVDSWKWYYYNNPVAGYFLGPGQEYYFTITSGDDVPSLETDPILFPECGPYLNSPDAYTYVSKEGFEVTWSGHDAFADCPAEVRIRVMDMGPLTWTDIDLMVPNTGSYTFRPADLSGLDPMTYQIQVVLIIETKEYIDEPGYDPRSWAWARTHSSLMLYLE